MKGDPVRKEYFPWYELAWSRILRITRLYEYYMETVEPDSSRELPRPVKMYFLYNNTLAREKRRFFTPASSATKRRIRRLTPATGNRCGISRWYP